jgi:hypothetical protein
MRGIYSTLQNSLDYLFNLYLDFLKCLKCLIFSMRVRVAFASGRSTTLLNKNLFCEAKKTTSKIPRNKRADFEN